MLAADTTSVRDYTDRFQIENFDLSSIILSPTFAARSLQPGHCNPVCTTQSLQQDPRTPVFVTPAPTKTMLQCSRIASRRKRMAGMPF
jgi:hypothetical protein